MEHRCTTLKLERITKAFPANGSAGNVVLRDFSLELKGNVFATVVGPNACGKSTLLNLIAGIMPPDAGSIAIGTSHGAPARVGYVWQDYRASLLPWLSIGENIAFPLRLRGAAGKERRKVVERLMAEFMPRVNPNGRCYELSGGQQQMISFLRSVVVTPDVYLFDEPFSALDPERRWASALFVERVWMERKGLSIFVSHDVDEAILLSDEVLLMGRGGQIRNSIRNELPRPRTIKLLTSPEHIHCREQVIEFLYEQNANQEINVEP